MTIAVTTAAALAADYLVRRLRPWQQAVQVLREPDHDAQLRAGAGV
ncbi:hypothetical protein ACH4VT_36870 [Streptomyces lydicus]